MRDYLRKLIINLFKPTLYFIEKNTLVGDSIILLNEYNFFLDEVIYTQDAVKIVLKLNEVFLFKFNAKKEIAKSILPINEKHIMLLSVIESSGTLLSNYEKTQILEDGENSEVYQRLAKS